MLLLSEEEKRLSIQSLLIINSMTEKLTAVGKIKSVLLFIKTFPKEITFHRKNRQWNYNISHL